MGDVLADSGHGPENLAGWIEEVIRRLDLALSRTVIEDLVTFFTLLREWNERINLTAVRDDEGMAVRHLLDSLSLLRYLERRDASLIDVGSGAGFPGLPLKIVRSDLRVVLLDSLAKRIGFLEAVIGKLDLNGISTWHGRAEDAAHKESLREHFDIATARAVASLPVLCEYCLPFVRIGGHFLAMKGQAEAECSDAQRAINLLGGKLEAVETFTLPGTDMQRAIIRIRKIRLTPLDYPRRAGKPEAQPLL